MALKTTHDEGAAVNTEGFTVPGLEFLLEAHVKLGPMQKMGQIASGVQRMFPIIGGKFEGPRLRGTVIPGGTDWPLKRPDQVTEIEANYAIMTHDGVIIRVRNSGIGVPPGLMTGRTYIRTIPRLEAPKGAYDWVNKMVLVGTLNAPGGGPDEVVLRFFEVV